MLMMQVLLDDARAVNDRLGRSIDELIAEMTAARDWARTVAMPSAVPPFTLSTDEQPLRPGPASRGPL
jgi:hypothetical protein